MGILYQLVLVWSLPAILTTLVYHFVRTTRRFRAVHPSRYAYVLLLGLGAYGLLSVLHPLIGPLLLTVTVLSVSAGGLLAQPDSGSTGLFEDPIPNGRFSLYLGVILILAVVFRLYRLGTFGYLLDEPWHFKTAVGYIRTGEFQFWNFYDSSTGKDYPRAWIYTWQVAQSLKWFGESLTAGRIVSVLWGLIVFVPLVIYNRLLNLNRHLRLLVYFLVATSPYLILSARWVRHYAMFTTLYLSALVLLELTIRGSYRNRILLGGFTLLNYGLLLHLHPAPALLLAAASLIYMVCYLGFKRHSKELLVLSGVLVSTVGLLVVLGPWTDLIPRTSGSVVGLVELVLQELQVPSVLNLFYGYYATGLSVGAGFGGLVVGVMLVDTRNQTELFFVLQLILPLLALLFLNRPIPSVRYVGYLIPVAIPLLVLFSSRLVGRATVVGKPLASLTLVVVLIGVPVVQFQHQLERIWRGHQDYVSFPTDNAQHYKVLGDALARRVSDQGTVLLLDVPSFHAKQYRDRGLNTSYRSLFDKRITDGQLRSLACRKDQIWVIVAYAYRDPTTPNVESVLEKFFRQVRIPNTHGIKVYKRTRKPRCR